LPCLHVGLLLLLKIVEKFRHRSWCEVLSLIRELASCNLCFVRPSAESLGWARNRAKCPSSMSFAGHDTEILWLMMLIAASQVTWPLQPRKPLWCD
jgi:hypothetical protein